jgi:drug/metabolite transporter (DMT)-like permease
MATTRPSRVLVVLAFAAVYIIWGSTYLGIRLAIETLPPFLMAATRFMIAGGILFLIAIFNGARVRQSLANWRHAFIIGGLLLLCGNGGVTWAEKYIASSFAALFVATEPLWVVVLNWGITHSRPNAKVLLGILIGLAGVGLLVSDGLGHAAGASKMGLIGGGVVLLASLAWAGGSVYASRNPIDAPTSMTSGMQMLAGGSLLMLLALVTGDVGRLQLANASWTSLGAFIYLLLFGSLVGFTAYSFLLKNVSPESAATYGYVNPVVAVLLGWSIAGEPLTLKMMLAAAIIVGSVILITTYGREHVAAAGHDSECPTPPCA